MNAYEATIRKHAAVVFATKNASDLSGLRLWRDTTLGLRIADWPTKRALREVFEKP